MVLKRTKEAIEELELTLERPVAPVSVEAHYSFDYAQVNVTFQNNFHCSQAPSTFSHQENVACLVFAAKHSLDRSHTSSMKLWTQGKGLMALSAMSTTIWTTMD